MSVMLPLIQAENQRSSEVEQTESRGLSNGHKMTYIRLETKYLQLKILKQ